MLRVAPAAVAFLLSSALVLFAWRRGPAGAVQPVDRSPDRTAYEQTCGRCHAPFDPSTHLKSEWRAVVNAMHERMSDRELDVAPETLELAIRYLEQHGR